MKELIRDTLVPDAVSIANKSLLRDYKFTHEIEKEEIRERMGRFETTVKLTPRKDFMTWGTNVQALAKAFQESAKKQGVNVVVEVLGSRIPENHEDDPMKRLVREMSLGNPDMYPAERWKQVYVKLVFKSQEK